MPKIIIAIGSKRGPKLNAVQQALEVFSPSFPPGSDFELVDLEVDSGVSHTPSSQEELMRGARQRAEALWQIAKKKSFEWHYFVGLEGGLDVVHETSSHTPIGRRVFLESWAYVSDGTHGHYGRSGGIELPEPLVCEVFENGIELAVAIDRFAGIEGIR
ncbi:MAG TPA: DUF84 family protein, partial [Candidatus Acidoferrum sp.]|nr:DUF84 family protein [Candidatus Acidoferrum sp.]